MIDPREEMRALTPGEGYTHEFVLVETDPRELKNAHHANPLPSISPESSGSFHPVFAGSSKIHDSGDAKKADTIVNVEVMRTT